jgi:hypothetical protein
MTISRGCNSEALEGFAAAVEVCAMVGQVKTKAFGLSCGSEAPENAFITTSNLGTFAQFAEHAADPWLKP